MIISNCVLNLLPDKAPAFVEMVRVLRRGGGLAQRVQLRRRRTEVLDDLPPKFASVIGLELTAAQRAAYRKAEEEGTMWLRSLGRELRISHVLELILRLKQICNFCPETGRSAKLVDLEQRLHAFAASDAKALVFSQFVQEPFGALRLARELRSFRPLVIAGGVDQPTRSAAFEAFERDRSRRVMILSLRAGGTGLNLASACRVVHFDRWWNPAVETQAEDRVHRIGQTRPIEVFAYLCAGTVEERIARILEEKRRLFSGLIDGVPARALAKLDLDSLLRAALPAF